ncbi:endonuclease V [Roseateles albus]|uniref:Endonuclease V n=1 Tax=Roseateles albus TaxID=2987525 RepID=A0ABT5K8Z1_9BURK|nr:endonuclease V [Roseateles albus]MDC8770392.1 endonuclease V [Roseateles albus]
MKLALDVHFEAQEAWAAAVAFDDWVAPEPTRTFSSRIDHVEKAVRGEPDLRALPCILQLLREHGLAPAQIELIIINGPVHLDAQETPGLGRHLYHALGGVCPIIGVAKTAPAGMPEQFEVHREEETRPLIITCVGIDLGAAKARLRAMHGRKRVPTLLKLVTRLAKGAAAER